MREVGVNKVPVDLKVKKKQEKSISRIFRTRRGEDLTDEALRWQHSDLGQQLERLPAVTARGRHVSSEANPGQTTERPSWEILFRLEH